MIYNETWSLMWSCLLCIDQISWYIDVYLMNSNENFFHSLRLEGCVDTLFRGPICLVSRTNIRVMTWLCWGSYFSATTYSLFFKILNLNLSPPYTYGIGQRSSRLLLVLSNHHRDDLVYFFGTFFFSFFHFHTNYYRRKKNNRNTICKRRRNL